MTVAYLFTGGLGSFGGSGGTVPSAADVRSGVAVGSGTGTLALPDEADVRSGTQYGAAGTEYTGTLTGGSDGSFTDDDRATLESVYHLLSAAGSTIEVGSSTAPDGGTASVIRSYSYHASEGRDLRWNSSVGYDLAGGVVTMDIVDEPSGTGALIMEGITMTVTGTSGAWVLSADLSSDQTSLLEARPYGLVISAVLVNGHALLLRRAVLKVG